MKQFDRKGCWLMFVSLVEMRVELICLVSLAGPYSW